jgi:hypothetical protein
MIANTILSILYTRTRASRKDAIAKVVGKKLAQLIGVFAAV